MTKRVLCVFAHVDDESFGALGTLLKHKEARDDISFLWFTEGRECLDGAYKCAKFFNVKMLGCTRLEDQKLDTYPFLSFISAIEKAISDYNPDIVYTNFIGDLNRDHRIVAEAVMVACRPCRFKGEVWQCFIPGTTELGLREFRKDRVEKIDREMKEKLIREWYPEELINGREVISEYEYFERWPR